MSAWNRSDKRVFDKNGVSIMRKLSVLMILIFVISAILSTSFSESGPIDQEKYLSNINLRKAIAYVVDREALISSLSDFDFDLLPVNYFVPEGFYSVEGIDFRDYDSNVGYSYNTEKAIEEWENAKEKLGVDTLILTYYCPDTPAHAAFSKVIKKQIQDVLVGLTIDVRPVPVPELLEIGDSGTYDMLIIGWSTDYPNNPDPTDFLNVFGEFGGNWGNYYCQKYTKLLESAETESNLMKRMRTLRKAESVMLKDVAIVPIFEWDQYDIVYYLSMSIQGDVE